MKRIILVSIFFPIFTSFMCLYAQWAITYGGTYTDEAHYILQTTDGGYIVAGYTNSFGAGFYNFWILKLNSAGNIEWQKTYGGGDYDKAYSIQQTNDGGYIVLGNTESFGAGGQDIWVLKLSSEGDIEWQKTYGGSDADEAHSILQTSDGGYIVAGYTNSFGAGWYDFWVLKFSSDGDIEWQKAYGGSSDDIAHSIQQTSDGRYIVVGETNSFGAGGVDIWILKLSSGGDVEWQKALGGSSDDIAYCIQHTIDGRYIVAGYTGSFGAGDYDFWISKFSSDGDVEWQKTYGGSSDDIAHSIQQTSDGGYIVAGSYIVSSSTNLIGAVRNDYDFWILKLSSGGDIEWQKAYGGNYSEDIAHAIQQTNDGGYIVAGQTASWGVGQYDFWIYKLSPEGNINPRCAFIRSTNAEVSDTDIIAEDTDITSENTDITPGDTNITPTDSNAIVSRLCVSDICTLILSISYSGGGTTDPAPGTYTYDTGTEVTLKAIPSSENYYSEWFGNVQSFANTIIITMDGDKFIEVSFYIPGGGVTGRVGGGSDTGSGCFISTAAYDSALHPHVEVLRDFKDKYLMPNKPGRMLVYIYYKYSPIIAELIAKHKVLKVTVRIYLLPLVAFSYSIVHFGPIITSVILVFIFVLPLFLIVFWRKRIIKRLKNYDS
jgi:uncharacterized delta-60 repeat protein